MTRWYERFEAWMERRGCCRSIYRSVPNGEPVLYLKRYYILRTPWGEVMLHQFFLGDDGPVHDHPFASCGWIIATGYNELIRRPWPGNTIIMETIRRWPGQFSWRPRASKNHNLASSFHKVELIPGTEGKVHTLFITGPRNEGSTWGFATPNGFVSFADMFHKDGTEQKQTSPAQWGYGFFPKKKAA